MIGADLDHQSLCGEALADRLAAGEITRDAIAHEILDPAGAERALFGIVAQDFVQPHADTRQGRIAR